MNVPFFSIIIPTFDRHKALAACIQAIRRLDYPNDRFEVIIVDDGSPVPVEMPTSETSDGVRIILLRQINAGPASARNLGAQHARGGILAFTDDDCTPGPQWLRELAQSVTNAPTGIIGGRVINGLVDNPYSTTSQIIVSEAYAFFHSRKSDLRFFSSNNMSVAAKLFHKSGGFDSTFRFSEDRDICGRWIRQGKPLIYSPGAIVHHHHHLTLSTFCRQHFNYGRGACQLYRKRALQGKTFFEPTLRFHTMVMFKVLFAPVFRWRFRTMGLIGLWQLANLAGFLSQAFAQTVKGGGTRGL